jgi:hypothetical protein
VQADESIDGWSRSTPTWCPTQRWAVLPKDTSLTWMTQARTLVNCCGSAVTSPLTLKPSPGLTINICLGKEFTSGALVIADNGKEVTVPQIPGTTPSPACCVGVSWPLQSLPVTNIRACNCARGSASAPFQGHNIRGTVQLGHLVFCPRVLPRCTPSARFRFMITKLTTAPQTFEQFQALPVELRQGIVDLLPLSALCQMRLVSREMFSLVEASSRWQWETHQAGVARDPHNAKVLLVVFRPLSPNHSTNHRCLS